MQRAQQVISRGIKMKRTLVLFILVVSMITVVTPVAQKQDGEPTLVSHQLPTTPFVDSGQQRDLTIRFERELTAQEIQLYEQNGIHFGNTPKNIGPIYIVKASDSALERLKDDSFIKSTEPLNRPRYLVPRDVSVNETYANLAWQMEDMNGYNLTGRDILIADLDTGINWNHPDFFFPDGPTLKYFETAHLPPDSFIFNNGTDGIDANNNLSIEANETLYVIDIDKNGAYHVGVDWLFLDNGTTLGKPDDSDTFFVVNDVDQDTQLTGVDDLIRLKTPKTKYIVHKPSGSIQVWDRNVNLTSCTFKDTDGHGTSVAGILNGGQRGYRRLVGLAPDAELMAINVFGNDGLTIEEGLIWARDHGADVILIEVGSWTYEFLDGSSNVERMINTLTASGIPVIVPAGNLQNGGRHTDTPITANTPLSTMFSIPNIGATEMYLTILSTVPVYNAKVNITEPTSTGSMLHMIILGKGYWNFVSTTTPNVTIDAFVANSTRPNMYMIAIDISGWLKDTSLWTITVELPQSGYLQFYIADDASSWSGGATWQSPTNTYLITWPSTADKAISVASYMSRNLWIPGYGKLAPYSSIGPRVDGQQKLSVAAPGGWDVISPWSDDSPYPTWFTQGYSGLPLYELYGGYVLFGGTSAAGPHVAAGVALMLQMNENCGPVAKDIIEVSAYQDGFTGPLPIYPTPGSSIWGYGKLNVCAAIEHVRDLPYVHELTVSPANPEYADTVTITLNISSVDYVNFDWSIDNWTTGHFTALILSGGLYTATIPAQRYGVQVDYRIMPVNTSAVANPVIQRSYVVGDTVTPVIDSYVHNATAYALDSTSVLVAVQASEPVNASGIAVAVLQFTFDNWANMNQIPMTNNGTHFVGQVPPAPVPMEVKFRVVVYDNAGNSATTSEFTYNVVTSLPNGTNWLQENLYLVIGTVAVVALVVIVVAYRKRK